MLITRRFEFDAGHRLPHHHSECRNVHGHRYVLEMTLQGVPVRQHGLATSGMIVDFGTIKQVVNAQLLSSWDHAFFVWNNDVKMLEALCLVEQQKTIIMEQVPTVENMAKLAFEILGAQFGDALKSVRMYETPNCWAVVQR